MPPPNLNISEWAERNIVLTKEQSARPGPLRIESYQREILDALLDPEVREIVMRKCTQIGWSEILNAIIGYFIDIDPCNIMLVQPTDPVAKKYSKKRIAPLIANCPALRTKVRESTSRRPGNTMQLKEFDGGSLTLASATSAPSLRSDNIRVVLKDEVDGWPDDVNGEGDPSDIADRRADSYADAKILTGSTPGKPKGISRIDEGYLTSSQGLFYVPCPYCNFRQPLVWKDTATKEYRLVWEKDADGNPLSSTVRYVCAECGGAIDEKYKQRMLNAGAWVHKFPERKKRGFHLNALYSPWRLVWPELAAQWVTAQDNPEKLKAFVNLRLGETWDEGGDDFGAHTLAARRHKYAAPVPRDACVLVATADIQNNRIEAQITAFGPGEQSWLIAHQVFWGDPGITEDLPDAAEINVWSQLDIFLLSEWQHECGQMLRPSITLIDSGAHADSVYDFVSARAMRRVYACKGVDYLSKPGLVTEGASKRGNLRLFSIATYAAKDRSFARMKIPQPGPGYMNLPEWVTDEYLDQLTGEKKITVRDKRTRARKQIYVKTHNRNEALDLTVYGHAGLFILQNLIDPVMFRDLSVLQGMLQRGEPIAGRARRRLRFSD